MGCWERSGRVGEWAGQQENGNCVAWTKELESKQERTVERCAEMGWKSTAQWSPASREPVFRNDMVSVVGSDMVVYMAVVGSLVDNF